MTAKEEYQTLLNSLPSKGIKIVSKADSKFWSFLGFLVKIVTFGQNRDFGSSFVTTIGKTIATPSVWTDLPDERKLEIITHELVHIEQSRKYTEIGQSFLYLFIPLPFGLAWFRYKFEREAYLIGFKKSLERNPELRNLYIDFAVKQLTGPNYGWAWPFKKSVRAWFERNL